MLKGSLRARSSKLWRIMFECDKLNRESAVAALPIGSGTRSHAHNTVLERQERIVNQKPEEKYIFRNMYYRHRKYLD